MSAPLSMLIVGAGFGGLGAAIHRRRLGDDNFLLVEQAGGVGGTWWANRYPGAACDIPSHLYSFSFAPHAAWTRKYPGQREIEIYLNDCVQRFGLAPRLRLHTRLSYLHWDEAQHLWRARVLDAAGHEHELMARTVTLATGPLSRPATPAIDGLAQFRGPVIHTARWPEGFDASGRRIGVIGTGASAIQLMPQLAPQARQLTVFQRSAPWVLPRGDAPIGALKRWALTHVPGLRRAWRAAIYAQHESPRTGVHAAAAMAARTRAAGAAPLAQARACRPVARRADAALPHGLQAHPDRRRLLPHAAFAAGAGGDGGDRAIEPHGALLSDGRSVELDTLVTATGFEAAELKPPCPVIGPQGRTLHALWAQAPEGYLGTMVAGFPNLFTVIGPNTGLGHNSMVFIIESQLAFIDDAMQRLAAHAWLSPTTDAQNRFNAELGRRLPRTVWATGGCSSWYQTREGRITTLWPGSTLEYRRRTRRLASGDFEFAFA